ncbi:MAG: hypothetical protein V4658_00125 [Bacteroidota bacterium]
MENDKEREEAIREYFKSIEVTDPEQQAEYNRREVSTRLSVWGKIVRDTISKYVEENPEVTEIKITWDKEKGLYNRFLYNGFNSFV